MNTNGKTISEASDKWSRKRLKFLVSYNDETLPETTDPDKEIGYVEISSVRLEEGVKHIEPLTFEKAPSRARRIVQAGDTIVSTVRTYLKAIAHLEEIPEDTIVSTGFAVIRPDEELDQRFSGYALQSTCFVDEVVARSTGVSYPAINPSDLVDISIPYPRNLPDQKKIADFLDRKTSQIDILIAKKRSLIAKLKEKRLAVITLAVTRGLNPDARLKDSGIEWLGEVPEHWEVVPLGFLVEFRGGMTPNTGTESYWDGDIPWVTPKDMKIDEISDSIDHVTEEAIKGTGLSLIDPNAILIVVRGMILAHSFPTAINRAKVTINQDMKALRCEDGLNSEYLRYTLAGYEKTLSKMATESAHGTRKMETGTLKKFVIPVPPVSEQTDIIQALRTGLAQLDQLSLRTKSTINRLTEYRTALITTAVTGQIKIN